MSEVGYSRRNFLKIALAVPIGIAAAHALVPASIEVNETVSEATGHPTGNAGIREIVETTCQDQKDPSDCYENYEVPRDLKIMGTFIAPVTEEMTYRALPSMLLDERWDSGDQDALDTLKQGTDYMLPTRQELLVGAISSLIFGLMHNLTNTGIDTKTIPASQVVGGFGFWALQRRLGLASNISAHMTMNYLALYKKR